MHQPKINRFFGVSLDEEASRFRRSFRTSDMRHNPSTLSKEGHDVQHF
jgi:hypothetical protein